MKFLASILILTMLVPSAYSETSKTDNELNKILRCTGRMAKTRFGKVHRDTAFAIADILQAARDSSEDEVELKAIRKECNKKRIELRRDRKSRIKQQLALSRVYSLKYSYDPQVQGITNDIMENQIHCKVASLDANVAVGRGIGVGVEGQYCTTSRGKRFVAVGLAGHLNFGGGATIMGGVHETYSENSPINKGDETVTVGVIPAVYIQELMAYGDYKGAGLGLGIIASQSASMRVLKIPLVSNYSPLINRLTR